MTDSPVDRTRRRTTHGWFLLAQTPAEPAGAPPPPLSLEPPAGFRERFPLQPCGEAFRERLEAFGSHHRRFAVLALHIDPAPPGDAGATATASPALDVVAAAEALDAACRPREGLWGLLEPNLLAAALPDMTAAAGETLAAALDADLQGRIGRRFTVGIAGHPCLDFAPGEALVNARKALDHAAFFGPGSRVAFDAVSLNISGDRRYEAGDLAGALAEYRRALALDPENANVLNSLGVCHGLQGRHAEALKVFAAALALTPGEVMPVYNTGVVHLLRQDREAALEHLLRAAAMAPEVFEVHFQTGKLLLAQRDAARALPFLERATRLNPAAALAHRLAGDGCLALKRLGAASHFYRRAIRLNPGDAAALSSLGKTYELLGERLEIPLTFCRQSVALAPDNGLYRLRLARLLVKARHLEEALEHFLRAGELGYQTARLVDQLRRRLEQPAQTTPSDAGPQRAAGRFKRQAR